MRRATLVGAVLAMVIAAPRAARCAGIAARQSSHGALVLSIAKVGARSAGSMTKVRELRTLLGLESASASYGPAEAGPQFALAIAPRSSPYQLSVAPTYEKIGRSRSPGVALSGRF
jgi:hypothetical protein